VSRIFVVLQDENISKFNALFSGEGSRRLFVLHQPSSTAAAGDSAAAGAQPELFISDGTGELLTEKCCYFLRSTKEGTAVDTTHVDDGSLLFGEMCGSALTGIEAALSRFVKPMLLSRSVLQLAISNTLIVYLPTRIEHLSTVCSHADLIAALLDRHAAAA
jgi:hypothetical protein